MAKVIEHLPSKLQYHQKEKYKRVPAEIAISSELEVFSQAFWLWAEFISLQL
jgi:hypothetical protein